VPVKRTTLKEVAALAGVSYQTVSKVINRQLQVSQDTEERIWRAVRESDYQPNQIARSMRTQRSRLIGYTWAPSPPDQPNPILDLFLHSMTTTAEENGYHLLCFPYEADLNRMDAYQDLIATRRVDGFILSGVEYNDPRVHFLLDNDFPFVAFGRSSPGMVFPFVDVDGADGLTQVTGHLIQNGHRRIAVLAWPESSRSGQERLSGYARAMRSAQIEIRPEWIARGEGQAKFGYAAALVWLKLPENERPTAIAAFNDLMAIGAVQAVRDAGLRVGVDLAITGYDDSPLIQYLSPPLTSVRQPVWLAGQRAVTILTGIMEGNPAVESQALLAPQLVVRASSGFIIQKP
jgi:DNA-binding LacI/PurR family transcriptional regulator